MLYCVCLTHFQIERMVGSAPFCFGWYCELATHMRSYFERVLLSLDYVFERYIFILEIVFLLTIF